ncbi:MAG: DUF1326 domain-containing protein [Acidobacteria bacterium]|nr:DUF1326 domain-containing protein [Acidobacteriota bacterium]
MKKTNRMAVLTLALAGVSLAAGPSVEVEGNYVEARSADVNAGSCFINSEVQLVGNLAVFGWEIKRGSWKGVEMGGLKVAAAVHAASTLGDVTGGSFPVKSLLIVDERANYEQRQALKEFARRMTGDLLDNIVRVEALPIRFSIDGESIHEAKVTLSAGTLASIRTRAIEDQDKVCGHEENFYPPLAQTDHAMSAYTLENRFSGSPTEDLRAKWSLPYKRNAYVATFHLAE